MSMKVDGEEIIQEENRRFLQLNYGTCCKENCEEPSTTSIVGIVDKKQTHTHKHTHNFVYVGIVAYKAIFIQHIPYSGNSWKRILTIVA